MKHFLYLCMWVGLWMAPEIRARPQAPVKEPFLAHQRVLGGVRGVDKQSLTPNEDVEENASIHIPIVAHTLGDINLKPSQLHRQIQSQLVDKLSPALHFTLLGMQQHPETSQCGHDALARRNQLQAWRDDRMDVLHVVVCPHALEDSSQLYATYPWNLQADLAGDGIYVSSKAFSSALNIDLARRFGTWLGLYPTYHGSCRLGDAVDDTPAQAFARGVCENVSAYCDSSSVGAAPNVMDDFSLSCATEFTAGQIERMKFMYQVYRAKKEELRPANDECASATVVQPGDSIHGTTVGAYFDGLFHTRLKSKCKTQNPASPAVFYQIEGRGQELRASLCNDDLDFYATITVYQGSCYTTASCLATQSRSQRGCSAVSWFAAADETYLLAVNDAQGQVGHFRLNVDTLTLPANNGCHTGTALINSIPVQGTTMGALDSVTGSGCGQELSPQSVWHAYTGSGQTVAISTCSPMTSFETELVVLQGECDETFGCVARSGEASADGNGCAVVTFDSVAGQPYKILVNGFNGVEGDYEVILRELKPPSNDQCKGAQRIGRYTTLVAGSTIDATVDKQVSTCHNDIQFTSGVWYVISGTGNTFQASTCEGATLVDTYLSLYTGTCGSLACHESNDKPRTSGSCSTVRWKSTLGEEYRLLVSSGLESDGATGDFELTIEEVLSPHNSDCASSEPIGLNQVVSSDTRGTSVSSVASMALCMPVDSSTPTPGHWFEMQGNGRVYHATTCVTGTDFDTQILVIGGSCGATNCLAFNDDSPNDASGCSSVQWQTNPGETYKILVNGYPDSKETGRYALVVKEAPRVANDSCDVSSSIDNLLNEAIRGSTLGARLSPGDALAGECVSSIVGPAAFYSFAGNGAEMIATTCYEYTSFDTQLTVLKDGCEVPVCVADNDDEDDREACSTIQWRADSSTQYHVVVHGFKDAFGDFELSVSMAPTSAPTSPPTPLGTITAAPEDSSSSSAAPTQAPTETPSQIQSVNSSSAPSSRPSDADVAPEDSSSGMFMFILIGGGAGLLAAAILLIFFVKRRKSMVAK